MSLSIYQQALSLYNQGDYEGAFDLLYREVDQKCLLLKAECKKQITDQYLYLIKETLDCKEYAQARRLKITYLSKFGPDTVVNAFQIPDDSLSSILKEEMLSNNLREVNTSLKEVRKSKFPYFVVLGVLFLALITCLMIKKQGAFNRDEIVDISTDVVGENKDTFVKELFLEGNKGGDPITMQLTLKAEGEVEGVYKDVLNDFGFTLSGMENAGVLNIKGFNRNLILQCNLSQISEHSYQGYIQLFVDSESDDQTEKIPVYLSDWLTDEDRYKLKSIIDKWNDTHTLYESDLLELQSLYMDKVLFYGQTLNAEKCIKLIRQTIEKYDSYNQKLVSDVSFTILNDELVKCNFTKRVTVDGKSNDYEAYLIFEKVNGHWIVQTESDKTTDAYFERLRKKKK